MAPIRVGVIGLTSKPIRLNSHGSWAAVAHLGSFANSPDYTVVAVSSASVESANRAIAVHGLPASTKAYGRAEDLASDPDVDLVLISIRVPLHREMTRPALLHKKQVYVEWPLGANLDEAEELTRLAHEAGVKTIVGLQARSDPLVLKVRELVDSGKIGRIVSSTVLASSSCLPMEQWPDGATYYLDMKSGGNEYTIWFGHFLDTFRETLGDFAQLQAVMKTSFHRVPTFDDDGKLVNPGHRKTSPEDTLVQGVLESGAVASLAFRKPKASVDGVGFRWLITGTEGEIEATAPEFHWQITAPGKKLRIRIGAADVEELSLPDVPADPAERMVVNTAGSYDAFAKGDETRYATFESALKTHRLLDRIVRAAKFNIE